MENTLENKAKFFAQYWGINCICNDDFIWRSNENLDTVLSIYNGDLSKWYAKLKPLSSISDEELIHVARLAHQLPKRTFFVDRSQDDIIYLKTGIDKAGIEYFISMRPKYATVLSTINFSKTETEPFKSCTTNIGSIQISSERPVPYIAIVDYLRSKGYALPFMGLSVETMIEYGWVRLQD